MSDATTDYDDATIEPANLADFLATEDTADAPHHSDIRLNGQTVRFYFREATRAEAIGFGKLVEDGSHKSLLEFDRQVLATLCVDPTAVTHGDVKRWQARKGSQAALGKLVQDVIEQSGIMVNGKEETERFSE